ncbi:MAG: hypothetical protein LBC94_03255 [Desulfovibrio sp.]|jgi:hypothetical protein|nr:hypothetical protein [Desulfovibrio sp.]
MPGRVPINRSAVSHYLDLITRHYSVEEKREIQAGQWGSFCVMAFWSGPMKTPEEWREILCRCDYSMSATLEKSILYFPVPVFLRFFGLDLFAAKWPHIRGYCPRAAFTRRALYDTAWSYAVSGLPLLPPVPSWFEISEREKKIVRLVVRHMGRSLEEFAQMLDMEVSEIQRIFSKLERADLLRVYTSRGKPMWFRNEDFLASQIPQRVRRVRYTTPRCPEGRTITTSPWY